MAKRHKLNRRSSEEYFSGTAQRVHPKNYIVGPMRGGIRL